MESRKRGRPLGSLNSGGTKPKPKNMSVDPEIVEKIREVSDELDEKFGFRPTVSQTIKFLINNYKGQ